MATNESLISAASSSESEHTKTSGGYSKITSWFSRSLSRLPSSSKVATVATGAIESHELSPEKNKFRKLFFEAKAWTWTVSAFERIPQALQWIPFIPMPGNGYYESIQSFFGIMEQCANLKCVCPNNHSSKHRKIFYSLHRCFENENDQQFLAPVYFLAFRLTREALHVPPQLKNYDDAWKATHNPSRHLRHTACLLVSKTREMMSCFQSDEQESFSEHFHQLDEAWSDFLQAVIEEKEESGSAWFGIARVERIIHELHHHKPSREKYQHHQTILKALHKEIKGLTDHYKDGERLLLSIIDYFLGKMDKPYTACPRVYDKDSLKIFHDAILASNSETTVGDYFGIALQENPYHLFCILIRVAIIEYVIRHVDDIIFPTIFKGLDVELAKIKWDVHRIRSVYGETGLQLLNKYAVRPHGEISLEDEEFQSIFLTVIEEMQILPKIDHVAHKVLQKNPCQVYSLIQKTIDLNRVSFHPDSVSLSFLAQKIISIGMKVYVRDLGLEGITVELAVPAKS